MAGTSWTDDGFEVVVGSDGALRVSAAELARHGVRPGARVRLVSEGKGRGQPRTGDEQGSERPKRKRMRGALAHMVTPEEVDALWKH